jgi:hypothetical protein
MPGVGLEPTILVFRRAKTVHAWDSATTVLGFITMNHKEICIIMCIG